MERDGFFGPLENFLRKCKERINIEVKGTNAPGTCAFRRPMIGDKQLVLPSIDPPVVSPSLLDCLEGDYLVGGEDRIPTNRPPRYEPDWD